MKTFWVFAVVVLMLSACATEPEPSKRRDRLEPVRLESLTIDKDVITVEVDCSTLCLYYNFDGAVYTIHADTVSIIMYGVVSEPCASSFGEVRGIAEIKVETPGNYFLDFDSTYNGSIDTLISVHW